jgi:signal peptidase II
MKVTRSGWAALAIAVVAVVLDQVTKQLMLAVPERVSQPVFGPLQLTRISNGGVSFGLFQAGHDVVRWAFVVFSVGVALLLAGWARTQTRLLPAVGLGLVIGGALGNAIDRARFGVVIDFIDVSSIHVFPWIFNVADSWITVGVVLLLLDSLRRERPA